MLTVFSICDLYLASSVAETDVQRVLGPRFNHIFSLAIALTLISLHALAQLYFRCLFQTVALENILI